MADNATCNAAQAMRAEAIAQLNDADELARKSVCDEGVYMQTVALIAIGHALVAIDLHLHELIEETIR